ncbi:hypothetical protein [Mesorhizobium sp. WSM2239]|uniref:Uncharacterized protein n=2 Tax=unclassified Mesorhizobium TaxID=325217 RepID=A0AAU8D2T0_9HYPH
MSNPVVKPLEWSFHQGIGRGSSDIWRAQSSAGAYAIQLTGAGYEWFRYAARLGVGAALPEAKAAAQADYERRILAALASPPAVAGEVVAWQRNHPFDGWLLVHVEDIPHYQEQGHEVRPLYAALPLANAVADGLSDWAGWDRSRGDWSEAKHKDAVCEALFREPWSVEDAHELLTFIERTWTKRPASPAKEGKP